MSARLPRRPRRGAGTRVGLFGLLGSGNIGNDGSLEAVLEYLAVEHPAATVTFYCAGAEQVRDQYGVEATPLHWYQRHEHRASGVRAIVLKVVGKGLDAFRTAAWVRRHDVVIVPGMGVLEATLPLRPWGFPYALLLLTACGRLFGTKVALVSVGANAMRQRMTRLLFISAARLAHYRSYRDAQSKEALWRMGVNVSADEVYPDLVFALPAPSSAVTGEEGGSGRTVGVGVMAYYGGNDDRDRAEQIHAEYLAKMERFVRWLVDEGRTVRLLTGDHVDESVVQELLADLREHRPHLAPSRVLAQPVSSLTELMRQIASVDTVVATRYHNVLCALKLAKPTVSLGYARKNDVLMADMGLADFCQDVGSFDVDRLIDQLTALEDGRDQLGAAMAARARANSRQLQRQFDVLSAALLPTPHMPAPPDTSASPAPEPLQEAR
ncbi:MAG: hypothetical protein GEV04_22310 [Actinophytocola sp.]|nr:hypothetical protein [Actinophytocola sp.]